jgi:hypothetical protein
MCRPIGKKLRRSDFAGFCPFYYRVIVANAYKRAGAPRKELAAINGVEDGMEKGMENGMGNGVENRMENGIENEVENGMGNGTGNGMEN